VGRCAQAKRLNQRRYLTADNLTKRGFDRGRLAKLEHHRYETGGILGFDSFF
jgi:hypothetical protein